MYIPRLVELQTTNAGYIYYLAWYSCIFKEKYKKNQQNSYKLY